MNVLILLATLFVLSIILIREGRVDYKTGYITSSVNTVLIIGVIATIFGLFVHIYTLTNIFNLTLYIIIFRIFSGILKKDGLGEGDVKILGVILIYTFPFFGPAFLLLTLLFSGVYYLINEYSRKELFFRNNVHNAYVPYIALGYFTSVTAVILALVCNLF